MTITATINLTCPTTIQGVVEDDGDGDGDSKLSLVLICL